MRTLTVLVVSLFITMGVTAQKLSGNISPLKGQKEVNVVLDFSGTLVNNQPEQAHIDHEINGKTEEEKVKWLKEWNEDLRTNAYTMLTDNLGKNLRDVTFTIGKYPNADITINIKVINIETGYFAGPFAKPSVVNANVSFIKKGESAPFATVQYKKCSNGFSSTVAYHVTRITMSFGRLGDELAVLINKNIKK